MNKFGFWTIHLLKLDCDVNYYVKQLYLTVSVKLINPRIDDYQYYKTVIDYNNDKISRIQFYYKILGRVDYLYADNYTHIKLYSFDRFEEDIKYGYDYMHGRYTVFGDVIFIDYL